MSTDPAGRLVPGAAEDVEILEDDRLLRFTLRPGLKWSDGSQLTAEDFARGIRHAALASNAAPQSQLLRPIKGFVEYSKSGNKDLLAVRAIDDRVIEIELASPTPSFLWVLEYPISYPRALETENADPVSNGPYILHERLHGKHTELRKNRYYRDENKVSIEIVRYLPITDESALVRRFRAGEIDVTSTVPNSMAEWFRKNDPDAYQAAPQLGTYFYFLNSSDPALTNKVIRAGLYHSIDRDSLVRDVMKGGQPPAYTLVPPVLEGFSGDTYSFLRSDVSATSIDNAKRLLHSQGYTNENPLKLSLHINSGANHQKIAIFVIDQWKQHYPLEIELYNQEFGVLLNTMRDRTQWQIIRSSWVADYPDALNFLEIFSQGNPNNLAGYESSDFDERIELARGTNGSNRIQVLRDAESLLLADYVIIPLYGYMRRRLVSSRVAGFESNPMGILRTMHLALSDDID